MGDESDSNCLTGDGPKNITRIHHPFFSHLIRLFIHLLIPGYQVIRSSTRYFHPYYRGLKKKCIFSVPTFSQLFKIIAKLFRHLDLSLLGFSLDMVD